MDFRFTPEQEAFRQEVRQFFRQVLPPDWRGIDPDSYFVEENWRFIRQLTAKMAQRGWLTLHWPKEYGGQGRSVMEQVIYQEETAYWRVPTRDVSTGTHIVGPTLMIYGTEEQKREFLPGISRGEILFCQGFSEPGAGSDLASLQMRAVEDGDDFILHGSKIWTSGAHRSTHCYLLARTDPSAEKHRGISAFIVDMNAPGITVRPILNMFGVHYFNQVFFDGVRVNKRYLVGEKNRGWYVAATTLDFERSGVGRHASNRRAVDELAELAREAHFGGKPLSANPLVRNRLADLAISVRVGTLVAYEVAWLQSQGKVPNKEASLSKLMGSETAQQIYAFGVQMVGLYGILDKGSKWAFWDGRLALEWADSFSHTIRAGTSEVQRNIIAMRGLGLPRG
ncbi:MAG: acyl-CoA dehydrogenase family protein [Dehalococcoidia bacterium]|nr:acyl-CoA dehydrogenase family protein [Dehalococcoidia bacterium]MDW8119974.1 acyl-CoA dehydrogenase family protein [Chloroflexota bacterium]